MAEHIDIVSVKTAVARGDLKAQVNEIGNILLVDTKSHESVKIGEIDSAVASVVRCKDCQNFYLRRGSCGESIPTCSVWGTTVYYDEFCGRCIRRKT